MKIIDLSHTIHADMPVFPGTTAPVLAPAFGMEEYGFVETSLQMLSHTGTHMDAPAHMVPGGKYLENFAPEQFFGLALIIDWPHCAGERIEKLPLTQMEDKIARAEFVLFNTGHSRHWGQPEYFGDFATLTPEAAAYLAEFPLKGVGVDAISVDAVNQSENPVHHILLGKGMVLIENLCNFAEVKSEYCMFSAMPLKFSLADGSPVRAVAIEMGTYLPVGD